MHRPDPNWGTHTPLLLEVLKQNDGPVLEMGMGISSTPLLHAMCQDRFLLSLDNDPTFTEMFRKFKSKYHKIELVNWEEAQIIAHWGAVLIDHKPEERRKEDIKKLADIAEFLVVHDTEPDKEDLYHYSEIYPLFKYRFTDTRQAVHTTVLSNYHALDFLHYSFPQPQNAA